jgi:hypothetical protein
MVRMVEEKDAMPPMNDSRGEGRTNSTCTACTKE